MSEFCKSCVGYTPETCECGKHILFLEHRLARVNGLLMDNYPCYDENKCKNCVGDFDEIDYRACVGYNVLRALREAEVKE